MVPKDVPSGGAWMPGSSPGMTEYDGNLLISIDEKRYADPLTRRRE
jgi:hypothetical protein